MVVRLFENLKMFYPRRESAKADPDGSSDGLSILLCVPDTVLGIFVSAAEIRLFENLKMFIPRRESAKADSLCRPFDSLSILLWSREALDVLF